MPANVCAVYCVRWGAKGRDSDSLGKRTQILDILIGQEPNGATWHLVASLGSSSLGLVNDNAVSNSGSKERSTVGELGHAAVVVHAQPGEPISNGGQNERHMPMREDDESASLSAQSTV